MRTTSKNTPIETPNSSEAAIEITKLVNAAGSRIEGAISEMKSDGAAQFERTKTRKGATIAADVLTASVGVAFMIAGGPVGIAAGVALLGGSLLHATTVTMPALRNDE